MEPKRSAGAGPGPDPAPERGRRRTRAELRELLLEAGTRLLLEEGLTLGAERVTFARVFEEVERVHGVKVTNAAVIDRIWKNRDDFHVDVVRAVIEREGDAEFDTAEVALLEALPHIDLSNPATRRSSLAELIRISAGAFMDAAGRSSLSMQFALAAYLASSGAGTPDARLIEVHRRVNEALTERYTELYQLGVELIGWRVRPGLSLRDAAVAISALAEGIVLRYQVDPDAFPPVHRVRAADGADVEWTLLGLVIDVLVEVFAEPDPDAPPPAG